MSEPNAFTGAALDRAEDSRRRDAGWLEAQRDDPSARAVIAGDAGVLTQGGRLRLVPLADAPGKGGNGAVLLGLDAAGPLFAVDEGPLPAHARRPALVGAGGRRGEPAPDAPGRMDLREAASVLPPADGGLAGYAAAMLNWHRSHRFCANCGVQTEAHEGGLARRCPRCRSEHHPRTDPVVIMLVTDGDRLLLGRQSTWPARRYSALAGFVSPGESLEEAVVREVLEEAGVQAGAPSYASSQPWPFPSSLMVGFTAPWERGEPQVRDDELQDVRWFDRDAVAAAAAHDDAWEISQSAQDDLLLPPRSAIARRLIEGWLRG